VAKNAACAPALANLVAPLADSADEPQWQLRPELVAALTELGPDQPHG
jgi:hypothetical protein